MGNLFVEIFREVLPRRRKGKHARQNRRVPIGILHAIPIEIVVPGV